MNTRNQDKQQHHNLTRVHLSNTSNVSQKTATMKCEFERNQDLSQQMDNIKQQYSVLEQNLRQQQPNNTLLAEIDKWQKDSVAMIQSAANKAKKDLTDLTQSSNKHLTSLIPQLQKELHSKQKANNYTKSDIKKWKNSLEKCQNLLNQLSAIKIEKLDLSSFPTLITIEQPNTIEERSIDTSLQDEVNSKDKSKETDKHIRLPQDEYFMKNMQVSPTSVVATVSSQQSSYPNVCFGVIPSSRTQIHKLFELLQALPPMNKNGPMNGDCDFETTQMETFLSQTFNFQNISRKYIVQGVQSFQLGKSLDSMKSNSVIRFPNKTSKLFAMTVQDIIDWQQSYAVYADKSINGMNKEFLQRALRGLSNDGEEAFCMKFVVRISTCPILMEFDAQIISREPQEVWPHRIKLVSVTGIDFAGRIHDINDITTYVMNWNDVYEIDPRSHLPLVYEGRDFCRKAYGPRGILDEKRLLDDLIRMARLRLRACDEEKVQIVVETGIGLGVFAGKAIGVDKKVRAFSARAIRTVLEEDGSSYSNIRGIVFALPIFDVDVRNGERQDPYQAFVNEFESNYKGDIPVFIADQDMHRLTVAIALEGFIVSELNPADSHGVFGEYWQNRGPAVEEKLALTTVGLLVQHHLINPHVLDPTHYHLI